jgi:hypothetical protein
MIDNTLENHLLFSDSRLEHLLLRYLQNNGGGSGFGRERSGQARSEHEGRRARLASARRERGTSKRTNQ